MLNGRMLLVGALGVMLGALPSRSLDGQSTTRWSARPSVEGFYTQLRLDGDGATTSAGGVGAKLMWSAPTAVTATRSLVSRTDAGVFAAYTPERRIAQGARFSTLSLGAVADVRPFEAPLAGRVDPFLSFGAGVLRTNVDGRSTAAPSPLLDRSRTAFTLMPGVGARVHVAPNLALQGDVRDMMTFRGDTRHNVAFGAGLRLTF